MVEDRFGHLAAGFDLRQHLLREPAAKRLLEAGDDFHPLERVEAEFDDIGIERQFAGPLLRDPPDVIEYRLYDVLRQFPVGAQGAGSLPHRP